VPTANEEIQDKYIAHQVSLVRYAQGLARRYQDKIATTNARLGDFVSSKLDRLNSATSRSSNRAWGEFGKSVAEIRKPGFQDAKDLSLAEMSELAPVEQAFAIKAINDSLPFEHKFLTTPTAPIVKYSTAEGMTLDQWWTRLQASDSRRIMQIARNGVAQGLTNNEVATAIRTTIGTTNNAAEMLARTTTNGIANASKDAFYKENKSVIDWVVFSATLDARTTEICFDGGTSVFSPSSIEKLYRSEYSGDLFTVKLSSGQEFRGTPNHPVLTQMGWTPIDELDPRQHILYAIDPDVVEVSGPEYINVPTPIAEVYDAVGEVAGVEVTSKSPSATDFYGDGASLESDIDITSTDGHLSCGGKSALNESIKNKLFRLVESAFAFSPLGHPQTVLVTGLPAVESSEFTATLLKLIEDPCFRSSELGHDLTWPNPAVKHFDSELSVLDYSGICFPSPENGHNVEPLEKRSDRCCTSYVLTTDAGGGFAAPVTPNNIISVRSEFESCHVYTLQVSLGYYTAGGAIVKNCMSLDGKKFRPDKPHPTPPLHPSCRSTLIPTISSVGLIGTRPTVGGTNFRTAAREKAGAKWKDYSTSRRSIETARARKAYGKNVIGSVPADTTYPEFLKRQPKAFQEEVLGKQKAQWFREGKLTVDKMVNPRTLKPLTLDEIRKREGL